GLLEVSKVKSSRVGALPPFLMPKDVTEVPEFGDDIEGGGHGCEDRMLSIQGRTLNVLEQFHEL
ncbi:MAG: hypothetical protein ACPGSB_02820, partial [Opitutales bacterium]